MKRFWLGWVQPGDDFRPISFPPGNAILGWWKTGECEDGATVYAWVQADTLEDAKAAIAIDWPESTEAAWLSMMQCPPCFTPREDRFPRSDWMLDRITPPFSKN